MLGTSKMATRGNSENGASAAGACIIDVAGELTEHLRT
jgi:hypothetical protein